MKKLLIISLILFLNTANASMIIDNLENSKNRNWVYFTDTVMGGVSQGKLAFMNENGENFYRMTGNVSTENNGGFIQVRANVSFANSEKDGNNLQGVSLNVRGNDETYYIHIRTNDSWSPSDYYFATFKADSDWQMINLPFDNFQRRRGLNEKTLDAKNITSFGIVAYGRDYTSDVSVSTIEFYY